MKDRLLLVISLVVLAVAIVSVVPNLFGWVSVSGLGKVAFWIVVWMIVSRAMGCGRRRCRTPKEATV